MRLPVPCSLETGGAGIARIERTKGNTCWGGCREKEPLNIADRDVRKYSCDQQQQQQQQDSTEAL